MKGGNDSDGYILLCRTHRDAEETLKELEGDNDSDDNFSDSENIAERFGIFEEQGPSKSCWQKYQPKVWQLLEDPYSSKGAEVGSCPAGHKRFSHPELSSQTSNKCSLKTVMLCLMFANICEH